MSLAYFLDLFRTLCSMKKSKGSSRTSKIRNTTLLSVEKSQIGLAISSYPPSLTDQLKTRVLSSKNLSVSTLSQEVPQHHFKAHLIPNYSILQAQSSASLASAPTKKPSKGQTIPSMVLVPPSGQRTSTARTSSRLGSRLAISGSTRTLSLIFVCHLADIKRVGWVLSGVSVD